MEFARGKLGFSRALWYNSATDAVVAQLAEQLIRNEQVAGSIPVNGSIFCCLILFGCHPIRQP